MQQRIIVIFLLLLFIYNLAGYYLTFNAQQYCIKEEFKKKIKNNIPENKLTILTFNPSSKEYDEINWFEDLEFRYNGQMYDIVKQTTDANGNIHFYCINDKQEEELFANLDEYIKKNSSNNSTNEKNSNDILKKVIKDYSIKYNCFSFLLSYKSLVFSYLQPCYKNRVNDILTPPPKKA